MFEMEVQWLTVEAFAAVNQGTNNELDHVVGTVAGRSKSGVAGRGVGRGHVAGDYLSSGADREPVVVSIRMWAVGSLEYRAESRGVSGRVTSSDAVPNGDGNGDGNRRRCRSRHDDQGRHAHGTGIVRSGVPLRCVC